MPAKNGTYHQYRGRGMARIASSDRQANLESVRRSLQPSSDEEHSATEHKHIAEEAEEVQNLSSPQVEEEWMVSQTAKSIEAPRTPFSNHRETFLTASEEQELTRLPVSSWPIGSPPTRVQWRMTLLPSML